MSLPLQATVLFVVLGAGCSPRPPGGDQPADRPAADQPAAATPAPPSVSLAPITDRHWILVSLGERSAPLGAGDRPLTLRLDSASSRATGFAGCNRYSGGYTLAGDSLRFGPAIATKMSCGESDQVERGYLAMLPLVVSFTASDTSLVLNGPGGALARFRTQ